MFYTVFCLHCGLVVTLWLMSNIANIFDILVNWIAMLFLDLKNITYIYP